MDSSSVQGWNPHHLPHSQKLSHYIRHERGLRHSTDRGQGQAPECHPRESTCWGFLVICPWGGGRICRVLGSLGHMEAGWVGHVRTLGGRISKGNQ